MGVRDALAETGVLAADVTHRGHGSILSLTGRQRHPQNPNQKDWQPRQYNRA
jgi:hypothetical protein